MNPKQLASMIGSIAALIESTNDRARVEEYCAYLMRTMQAYVDRQVPEPIPVSVLFPGGVGEAAVEPSSADVRRRRLRERIAKMSELLPEYPELEDTISVMEENLAELNSECSG